MTPEESQRVTERLRDRGEKKVKEIIEPFLEKYPNAEYGPAHIVVGDFNLEDDWILSSLSEATDEMLRTGWTKELAETIVVLSRLLAIPERKRTAWYKDIEDYEA